MKNGINGFVGCDDNYFFFFFEILIIWYMYNVVWFKFDVFVGDGYVEVNELGE